MKRLLPVLLLVSACAIHPVEPGRVSVEVAPPSVACGATDHEIPITLTVRNGGRGRLRFNIEDLREQKPYILSWVSYDVLDGTGTSVAWEHGPGDHGSVPWSTLSMGQGDTVQLVASFYALTPPDYAREFRIRIEDTEDNAYVSPPFKPCIAR